MSEHTPTPWTVSSAICGKHDTETVSIYHYPHDAACYEVVETGCKCGDEALTEANARHIVHCVNNHERLVEMLYEAEGHLRTLGYHYSNKVLDEKADKIESLLLELEAEKGGEL